MPVALILQLLFFVFLMAAGQLLFKQAALTSATIDSVQGVMSLLGKPWFWMAIALYGAGTFLWIYILQQTKLSVAYPFSAAAFVVVPLAAALLFGEAITPAYMIGALLIVMGIAVIAWNA